MAALLFCFAAVAHAAVSGQAVTPINVSVPGGDTFVFAARFYDGFGRPAVGEKVRFSNDTCGTFPNGGYFADVTTDATGLASTTFRAFNQGITCWLVANAGVQVRFEVLTFVASNVYFSATTNPPEVRPGQTFTVTAAARYGLYNLYNADIAARVVPGTASASVFPPAANSGQAGNVTFTVTPDGRIGDYEVEFEYRGKVQRLPVKAPANPWQDMWWGGSTENGWGVSVIQHKDVLFSVIYAYDTQGKPTWFVMPGGTWNESHTAFTGALFAPKGSPYTAYDPAAFSAGSALGEATLTFTDSANVALEYNIAGNKGHKNITRQMFGAAEAPLASSWGDMWWGGATQAGWGIAVLQQYRTLFAVWFTYDAKGAPTWFVMPSGYWSDATTYEGRVFRASGSPWLVGGYDAKAFKTEDVGAFRLHFNGDTATFDYLIEGKHGAMPLSRQPF